MKLLLDEPGAVEARRAWQASESRVASVALVAEGRAALAAARRASRIDRAGHAEAVATLGRLWSEMDGIVLTEALATRAGELAEVYALRGYDAVHLASAEAILDPGSLMVVSDTELASAAAELGILAVVPIER